MILVWRDKSQEQPCWLFDSSFIHWVHDRLCRIDGWRKGRRRTSQAAGETTRFHCEKWWLFSGILLWSATWSSTNLFGRLVLDPTLFPLQKAHAPLRCQSVQSIPLSTSDGGSAQVGQVVLSSESHSTKISRNHGCLKKISIYKSRPQVL